MIGELTAQTFLDAAKAWICEGYHFSLSYIGKQETNGIEIIYASLKLTPLPAKQDLSFQIKAAGFVVGHIQNIVDDPGKMLSVLADAASGTFQISDIIFSLSEHDTPDFYSEMANRDSWFSELHLQVSERQGPAFSSQELARVDNELRLASTPFDGLTDVATWLGKVCVKAGQVC